MNSEQKVPPPRPGSHWLAGVRELIHAFSPGQMLHKQADVARFYGEIGIALGRQFGNAWIDLLKHPERAMQNQIDWIDHQLDLARNLACETLGIVSDDAAAESASARQDPRFADPDWKENPLFNWIHHSYLINAEFLQSLVNRIDEDDPVKKRQLEYFMRQFVSALSPSNYVLTNPQVLRESLAQHGHNLIAGARKLLRHFDPDWDGINLHMSDATRFRVGDNLATCKGSVVHQNRLMQLIQYDAVTPAVWKRPLLLVPPCVNKYYVMDLSPENSMIRWYLEQGHTVFAISWVNPDRSYADTRFDDYLLRGPIEALEVITDICACDDINAAGYCLGGTMLAVACALLKSRGDNRIRSMTCFNSLFDYSQPGDLAAYMTDPVLDALETFVRQKGFHDGRIMAFSFNTLAENSLFWPAFVNTYLRNQDPPAFDLLYWNMDNTNLPAEMYVFFLREIYQRNKLATPGGISIDGTPIDLSTIDMPCYFVASINDHITPWQSTLRNTQIVRGPSRFVLSGSGHIVGIINPPSANKYGYQVFDGSAASAEAWLQQASRHPGSWWPDWQRWVESLDAERVPARAVGNPRFPTIEAAPGSYVMQRLPPATN